jgi:hypothetical protein
MRLGGGLVTGFLSTEGPPEGANFGKPEILPTAY